MSTRARVIVQIAGAWRSGGRAHEFVEQKFAQYCIDDKVPPKELPRWRRTLEMWKALPAAIGKKQIFLLREPRVRKTSKSRYAVASRYLGTGKDLKRKKLAVPVWEEFAARRLNGRGNVEGPPARRGAVVGQARARFVARAVAPRPAAPQLANLGPDWYVAEEDRELRLADILHGPDEAVPAAAPEPNGRYVGQRINIIGGQLEWSGPVQGWVRVNEQ